MLKCMITSCYCSASIIFYLALPTNRGETELYEDDGNTTQYTNNKYAKTVFSFGHESAT